MNAQDERSHGCTNKARLNRSIDETMFEFSSIFGQAEERCSYPAAVALGSNLGNSYHILESALKRLADTPQITLQAQSSIYQTVAIGPPQPDYLNAAALLTTRLDPQTLLQTLLALEAQFGRVRRERWGPRLLDLDLLFYDNCRINSPLLQLPHPHMTERAFVLVPLAEIAPHWIHPITQMSVAEMVEQVDQSGVHAYHAANA